MNVAVLAGGPSLEREVSLRSGHRVQQALASAGNDAVVLDPTEVPLAATLTQGAFDVCYVALHGKDGEDGTVQRLLELLGLPYTGTGPFACQIAFEKALAKEALAAAGVATPPWVALQSAALRDLGAGSALDRVVERLGLPLVVKPSRAGSAMGLKFVEREADLAAAVMGSLSFSDAVVVESKVEGTEIAAGTLGDPFEVLPLVEVVPRAGVYDYAARYTAGACEYFAPARLGDDAVARAREEASRAVAALGLRDVARVDLIVDGDDRPWVLEANVSPGMTETSLLPMAAQAGGMSLDDLCERVVELALARSPKRVS
ncbi:MAG: D-alanine--D-alanine ligase [Actinomycetota bacterium]